MTNGGATHEIGGGAVESAPIGVPHLSPGLEISPARAPDGKTTVSLPSGRYFEVSAQTALLLGLVDGRRDVAALAALLSERASPPISAAALRDLLDRSLVPRGLVHWGEAPPDRARTRSPMWLRVPLLGAGVVNAAAAALAPIFRPAPAAVAGALALAAHAWFYLSGPQLGLDRQLFRTGEWLPPVLLYQLSVLAHEFGHAAALSRFGERPGQMGCGFYRIFPVFFTDVTRAWRLPRLPRAVVDAGGMYVQVLFAGALIALYAATRSAAPARAVALVDLSLIANLNPFLRMDGYWLAADLSETRDLRGRSLEIARGLIGRGRGEAARAPWYLTLYALLSLIYFPALALWLVLGVAPRLAALMSFAWRSLRAADAPGGRLEPAFFLALGVVLMVAIAAFAWTGARTMVASLRPLPHSSTREEPPAA